MSGQMQWIIALVSISLFTIAIINFSTNFAYDNNSSINIANDQELNNLKTGIVSNISSFQSESENTYTSIINSTIAPGSTTTTSSGQYAITSGSAIGTSKNILLIGYQKIFGTEQNFGIFLTALFSIIGFVTILYVVKIWRAGITD